MTKKIIPTNNEIQLSADEFIVSKTDTQSHIIYINRVFMQISGYSEKELLGNPHNMIRHPEMPRAVFKMLWEEIKSGKEFLGYVKNLCKDGSYYWVLAHVTPDWGDDGKVIAYYSVRRRASRQAVEEMTEVYKTMCSIESKHQGDRNCKKSIDFLKSYAEGKNLTYFQLVLKLDSSEGDEE